MSTSLMTSPVAAPAEPEHAPHLEHHFVSADQQRAASKLGMWIFLATEVLFFGGLFVGYGVLRYLYPETFLHAHEHLSVPMGSTNTVVLITSSLTMALAVRSAQLGQKKPLLINLALTFAFACTFLVIKYFEYAHKFHEGLLPGKFYHGAEVQGLPHIFFGVYFVMTGLHGVHVIAGLIVIGWIFWRALKDHFSPAYFTPVENVGLYWHLVDIVWIFLFPLLYLVR